MFINNNMHEASVLCAAPLTFEETHHFLLQPRPQLVDWEAETQRRVLRQKHANKHTIQQYNREQGKIIFMNR